MARAIRALVDGSPLETIPIDDRDLQYGHGMFETCRVVVGRIPLWQFHRARLSSAAVRLGIPLDIASVDADASQLATDHADAVLKALISAGGGGRGYRDDAIAARRIGAVFPAPAETLDRVRGVTVRLCRMRFALQPMLAGLKHLSRLEQVLARGRICASFAADASSPSCAVVASLASCERYCSNYVLAWNCPSRSAMWRSTNWTARTSGSSPTR